MVGGPVMGKQSRRQTRRDRVRREPRSVHCDQCGARVDSSGPVRVLLADVLEFGEVVDVMRVVGHLECIDRLRRRLEAGGAHYFGDIDMGEGGEL